MQNHTDPDGSHIVRLLEEAEHLGALDDPRVLCLFQTATATPEDRKIHQLIDQVLAPYRVREAVAPDPLRPYPGTWSGLHQGDIEIAAVNETNIPWRVPLEDIPHTLVVGPTGMGKSHCVRRIVVQCAGRIPFVLVTLKADESRLLDDPPAATHAVRFEELKLSLFTPPKGVPAEIWIRQVVEMLCQTFGLKFSRALLYECCDRLTALYSRFSHLKGYEATFTPRNLLDAVKQRKSKYLDGIVAALEMLSRSTGDVFEYSLGYELTRLLLGRGCVLIVSSLPDERVARFVVDYLMEWAFSYLQSNGPNDGSPQLIFCLDDAHRFLTAAAEKDGLMPLSHRYLIARQAGLRILAVSQYPADLAPAVLSQSSIIIQVGGLANLKDIQAMGTALGLHSSQWARLHTPHKGEIVARENLGRYDRPFAGTVPPPMPSPIAFSEADRVRIMTPILSTLSWKPAIPLCVAEQAVSSAAVGATPARIPGHLSPAAYNLACDILANPWDLLPTRCQRLSIAGRPAQAAKDELMRLGWVKEHPIPTGSGRPPLLLQPLQAMCSALGHPMPPSGKGGFLHAFVMRAVVETFKSQGYTNVATEKFFGSKAIDVVATSPIGQYVAAEITISLVGVVDQVEKDFIVQPQLEEVMVVCRSLTEVRQAQRAIDMAPGLKSVRGKIRVSPVAWFL